MKVRQREDKGRKARKDGKKKWRKKKNEKEREFRQKKNGFRGERKKENLKRNLGKGEKGFSLKRKNYISWGVNVTGFRQ